MTTSSRPQRTIPVSAPTVPPLAGNPADDDGSPVCGWFESSWALREGLAVQELGASELPDPDGTLAALWFAASAASAQPGSSRWQ